MDAKKGDSIKTVKRPKIKKKPTVSYNTRVYKPKECPYCGRSMKDPTITLNDERD